MFPECMLSFTLSLQLVMLALQVKLTSGNIHWVKSNSGLVSGRLESGKVTKSEVESLT